MTKSINPGDIGRINPNFKVNDFRQMVNYQSGTNKGYVRFTRTSIGGLKLEKINNKVDVPLSWRSNVGAANNRLMRQKFVEAMSGDLRYVGETQRNHIRDMVLTPRNDEGEIRKDTALSRRENQGGLGGYGSKRQANAQSSASSSVPPCQCTRTISTKTLTKA